MYKLSFLHCDWRIRVYKMRTAIIPGVPILYSYHRFALDIRARVEIALDGLAVFLAPTGVQDIILDAHCNINM
jgi:hypothetical protein